MIRAIQEKWCKVEISNTRHPRYPGTQCRVGFASGGAGCILTAISLVVSEVHECKQQESRADKADGAGSDSEQFCITILIPDRAAGAVIGRRGETVARLQKESAATIIVARSNDCKHATQLSKERPVDIKSAELQGLLHAIGCILTALAESKFGPDYENETLKYPREESSGRSGGRDGGGRYDGVYGGRGRGSSIGGERDDYRRGRGAFDDMYEKDRGISMSSMRGSSGSYGDEMHRSAFRRTPRTRGRPA